MNSNDFSRQYNTLWQREKLVGGLIKSEYSVAFQ